MRINTKRKGGEIVIPLGYSIRDGKIVIDDASAGQVRELFKSYVTGESLNALGGKIGRSHTSITRILGNRTYLGDENFPAIIDEELFSRAAAKKAEASRTGHKKTSRPTPTGHRFSAPKPQQLFDDPFMQAEYAYSVVRQII